MQSIAPMPPFVFWDEFGESLSYVRDTLAMLATLNRVQASHPELPLSFLTSKTPATRPLK